MHKIKYTEEMLGTSVSVLTNKNAKQRGFEVGKVYTGELLDKVDWFIGCPVFKCRTGMIALGYECDLIET